MSKKNPDKKLKIFLRGPDSWTQPLPPRPLGAKETLKCGGLREEGFSWGVTKAGLRRGEPVMELWVLWLNLKVS